MNNARITHQPVLDAVKDGDLMALLFYVKVVSRNGEEVKFQDVDHDHEQMVVTGQPLIVNSLSADQFSEEVKLCKTKTAEILVHSPNRPLTVCFVKDDGTERTLRGRFLSEDRLMGRSLLEDLDLPSDKSRIRYVDHRSIRWLIVDGVKYIVK